MSELKCPVCGEKIEHITDGWCNCKNRCIGSGSIDLWLNFIRTREELHKANAELDYIKEQVEKSNAFIRARIKVAAEQIARGIIDQVKTIKEQKDN